MNRLCLAVVIIMSALLTVSTAYSQRAKPSHGAPGCQRTLEMCTDDLDTCDTELAACEAAGGQISPGDGYSSPGPFGLPGHVPALSYTDNFDGTFTDDNTGCMWEKKLKSDGTEGGNCTDTQSNRSVHCVNNTYPWTAGTTASDGTLFTEYLDTLNNKCDGDETTLCATDANCTGIGNGLCGHAGYGDWIIPNVKHLQSIVDYSVFNPSSIVPGATRASDYWSSTTFATGTNFAWGVNFSSAS